MGASLSLPGTTWYTPTPALCSDPCHGEGNLGMLVSPPPKTFPALPSCNPPLITVPFSPSCEGTVSCH